MSKEKSVDSVNYSLIIETLKDHKLYQEAKYMEDLLIAYLQIKGDLLAARRSSNYLHEIIQEKY